MRAEHCRPPRVQPSAVHPLHHGATDVLPLPAPLPAGLIAPLDDGAAAHLPGHTLPAVSLRATDGTPVALNMVATGRWVLFCYPLTGEPGGGHSSRVGRDPRRAGV